MAIKEDCLKMLDSITITKHGYIIPNNRLDYDCDKQGTCAVLKEVMVKECIEYLKNMLIGE